MPAQKVTVTANQRPNRRAQANRQHAGARLVGRRQPLPHEHAGVYFNTPRRLMEQAEGEDIRVLNNLICNKEQRIPDIGISRGSGQIPNGAHPVSQPGYHPPSWGRSTFLNEEHRHPGLRRLPVRSSIRYHPHQHNPVPRGRAGRTGRPRMGRSAFRGRSGARQCRFRRNQRAERNEPLYKAWNCGYRVVATRASRFRTIAATFWDRTGLRAQRRSSTTISGRRTFAPASPL